MPRPRYPLLAYPAYVRFWLADAISIVGSSVTGLALQVVAVVTLKANGTEVGILNAARWLPYLLLGLLAGVFVDRAPPQTDPGDRRPRPWLRAGR